MDWFFGIDMGIYYHPGKPAIVPDGFLSVGVWEGSNAKKLGKEGEARKVQKY
jgi:hypothetical protein